MKTRAGLFGAISAAFAGGKIGEVGGRARIPFTPGKAVWPKLASRPMPGDAPLAELRAANPSRKQRIAAGATEVPYATNLSMLTPEAREVVAESNAKALARCEKRRKRIEAKRARQT